MERRQLLKTCVYGSLGLSLGAGGVCALTREEPETPVVLGPLSELRSRSLLLFPAQNVLLLRGPVERPAVSQGIAFVSTRCTHLGCSLRLLGRELVCPCHGGRFSCEGKVLAGPPQDPLKWLEGGVSASGLIYYFPAQENVARRFVPG
jgi:Rieske Fe-S protein